ncbi:MAG: glutathione S-transferase family protein [Candidatus Omnitrophota bacterium]|nr:glutathione S-transferase family protein [Candidatus Omnitrophota bacterium]MDZ4242064.1 glutathione S-transferase family protein [Candidatus Omnitrophota bacterium]
MSEFTLVIGNKNYSSWSMRPWLVMRHFGIPFDEIVIPLGRPDSKTRILEHSPSGKVPVLKHKGILVWESVAILEYLADVFPDKGLWPPDIRARAAARAVSAQMHAGFVDMRKNFPMNVRARKPDKIRTPEAMKDVEEVIRLWEDCRKEFGGGGDFLFGEFSIADGMYAPVIWRFRTYGIELNGAARKYSEAMLDLPAMKEWKDLADKEPFAMS